MVLNSHKLEPTLPNAISLIFLHKTVNKSTGVRTCVNSANPPSYNLRLYSHKVTQITSPISHTIGFIVF